jgi:hypothetical protein
VHVAGTYTFTVTSSPTCAVADRLTPISASIAVPLTQNGPSVAAHVDSVDTVLQTQFVDLAGTVNGTMLSLTLTIRESGKFQSFTLTGSAVGTIQGQTVTGTVNGLFRYLNSDSGRPDLLNCNASDHAFTMTPPR